MNNLISIIAPVYNVETYIERFINSVISQTYSNWELILVDDGSTDNSGIICDKYTLTDKRIKTFHQPNHGVSSARNFGLKKCFGDYISFVDTDDENITSYITNHFSPSLKSYEENSAPPLFLRPIATPCSPGVLS